jgi:hypothetical protein
MVLHMAGLFNGPVLDAQIRFCSSMRIDLNEIVSSVWL